MSRNLKWLLKTILLIEVIFVGVLSLRRRLSISEQNFETLIKTVQPSELHRKDEDGNTLLHQAAEKGYLNSVHILCGLHLDVNGVNNQHKTPMHVAASNGNRDVIDILAKNDADVDSKDDVGRTPLYLAAIEGHLDVIKALVRHGADVETSRDNSATGLYQASFGGHLKVVEYFLEMAPGLLHKTKDTGASSFYVAAFAQQVTVMAFLLSKGADINQQKTNGETALTMASKKGFTDVVTFLLKNGANKDLAKHNGATAIFSASEYGRLEVVKILLGYNVDVNKATNAGETPLFVACVNKQGDIAKLLLSKQAYPNLAGQNDFLPIHISVEAGDLETVTELIHFQASVNVRSANGLTPLMIAASEGFTDIVKILVECEVLGCPMKANIDAVNSEGESALYLATEGNHKDVIEYLLKKSAVITVGMGKLNAFFCAIEHNKTETVKLFFDTVHENLCFMTDQSGNTPLHIALSYSISDIFMELLQQGCYNDYAGEFLRTPLFLAAMHGNSLQVKLLLKNNANPNTQTLSGETPLYIAAQRGHMSVVEQLLQAGALPDLATRAEGSTPLLEAAMHGHGDVVEILLTAHADINKTTVTDKASALCVAILFSHREVVELLLKHNSNANHLDSNGENALFLVAQDNFHSVESGIMNNVDSTDKILILEMLIRSGVNITHLRNDNLSVYDVAKNNKNKEVARRLLTTGYFKDDETIEIHKIERPEPHMDVIASLDMTLIIVFVAVVACLPYVAFKISCLLDDKDVSPRRKKSEDGTSVRRINSKLTPDISTDSMKTDRDATVDNAEEEKWNVHARDESLNPTANLSDQTGQHQEGEYEIKPVQAPGVEGLPVTSDSALTLPKSMSSLSGVDPGRVGSIHMTLKQFVMIQRDRDSWVPLSKPISKEEEKRFHNGGSEVKVEGKGYRNFCEVTQESVLCNVHKLKM